MFTVPNFKQNTWHCVVKNDVRPHNFKIIRLAHVRFETPALVMFNVLIASLWTHHLQRLIS
jgi:hypothetical protein